MEISPELKDTIKKSLSGFLSGDEVEQFMNLSNAINSIKQGQLCWQAPISIGLHATILRSSATTDDEKALLQELVGHSLEPLEALLESLISRSCEESRQDERDRMLFHTRFALGFLLLAKGDKGRSKAILHEMFATPLSIRGDECRSGPGIVKYTPDIGYGKGLAAAWLFTEYFQQGDYKELLYIMTEAAYSENWNISMITLANSILDLYAAECEQTDASQELGHPDLRWLNVFEAAGDVLATCGAIDSSGALPNECEIVSAQFLAWYIGQLIGRFAVADSRWRENPIDKLEAPKDYLKSCVRDENKEEFYKMWHILGVVSTLLIEYELHRDWQKLRQHYIDMWQEAYTYRGTALSKIGPESDLYWAMRIGFSDKILETIKQETTQIIPEPLNIIRYIENTKDIVSTIALRQLKQQQDFEKILQHLPPSKREILQSLQQRLNPVWQGLPKKVINTLVKAEGYYRTEVNDDDAKVWFHKAVEAAINDSLVTPLIEFIQEKRLDRIEISFLPPRGLEFKNIRQIERLSIGEWTDILEYMVTAQKIKNIQQISIKEMREFMNVLLVGPHWPDINPLIESLRKISQYRGGSAHYQKAISRHEKEERELEEMRKIVLGIDQISVITQIYQLSPVHK